MEQNENRNLRERAFLKDIGKEKCNRIIMEPMNLKYESFTFKRGNITYKHRCAKKTPKKEGYFLAIWTRNASAVNVPFDFETFDDSLIVTIEDGTLNGYFKFPKAVLLEHNILKSETSKGKMAFRVYPSWCKNLNSQASKTKTWQENYFYMTC